MTCWGIILILFLSGEIFMGLELIETSVSINIASFSKSFQVSGKIQEIRAF
jgi:hypothetical protein